jgi:hypothetical protein
MEGILALGWLVTSRGSTNFMSTFSYGYCMSTAYSIEDCYAIYASAGAGAC